MAGPELIVIVARQRSGTTALAETMASSSEIQSFGEVFHDLDQRERDGKRPDLRIFPEANFFTFRADLFRREPKLAYPSVESQSTILDLFLEHLSGLTAKSSILIDVKYNSWHHFEHAYSVPGHAPFLLYLLKQRNAAFAHITRTSSFSRYCSEQLALKRGIWHAETRTDAEAAELVIDPFVALRDMIETQRQVDLFGRFLRNIARRIELRYETLFESGMLSPAADAQVMRLLDGQWTTGRAVPLQKVTPPLSTVVKNRDEVIAYFSTTTYANEVEAALAPPA